MSTYEEITKVKGKVDGQRVRYILTNYKDGSFDLYNKTRGHIISISEVTYNNIMNGEDRFGLCRVAEKEFFR